MRLLLIPNYYFKFEENVIYTRNTEIAIFEELEKNGIQLNVFGNIDSKKNDLLKSKFLNTPSKYFSVARNLSTPIFKIIGFSIFFFKFIYYTFKNDFVYIYIPFSYAMIISPIFLFKKNFGFYIRGEINTIKGIEGYIYRKMIKKSKFNLCTGQSLTAQMQLINPNSYEVVPMLSFDTEVRNKILDIPKNEINLLYFTGINKNKGVFELLDTADEITTLFPNVNIIIAGSGPDKEMELFYSKYAELRNKDKIKYLGRLENRTHIQKIYSGAHIFLHLSHSEGFPRAVLEAMMMGLVVVSSDIVAIHGFLQNKKNAMLFEAGNKVQFINCVSDLLNNQELFKRLQIASINSIENKRKYYFEHVSHATQIALELRKLYK